MQIAVYAHRTDPVADPLDVEWSDLVGLLSEHRVGEKDGLAWSPATFAVCAGECGVASPPVGEHHRHLTHVREIHCAVLDLDEGVDLAALREKLDRHAYAIHSTHSHKPWAPKLRLVLPLVAPFDVVTRGAAAWKVCYRAIGDKLGIKFDDACAEASRLHYFPARPPDGPPPLVEVGEGVALRLSDFVISPPPLSTAATAPGEPHLYRGTDHPAAVKQLAVAVEDILASKAGADRHTVRNAAAYHVGRYVGGGYLDLVRAERSLIAAATSVSDTPDKAAVEVRQALTDGMRKPADPDLLVRLGIVAPSTASTGNGEGDDVRRMLFADTALEFVNRDHAVITSLNRIIWLPDEGTPAYLSPEAFRLKFGNRKVVFADADEKKIPLAPWWLAHPQRRQYDRVGLYAPPVPVPPSALNLWRGFSCDARKGDWSLMRAHIVEVLASGNQEIANYILRWIAWLFQNPGVRAEAVIALRGEEGFGKGFFGNALADILGLHAVHIMDPELFASGRFNGHLERCVFLFADECHWPGDKRHEGRLKGMLTEPTLAIERKGVDAFTVPNTLHVLISSNSQWVVPAGPMARRFVVADVSGHRRGDFDYFSRLKRELDSGGREAMLHDLLAMDLGEWHPRKIVETDALRDQKDRSLSPENEWLLGVLEEGALPKSLMEQLETPKGWVAAATLRNDAEARVPVIRNRGDSELTHVLRAIGVVSHRHGKQRVRGWKFPTLPEARARWEAARGKRSWCGEEWDS